VDDFCIHTVLTSGLDVHQISFFSSTSSRFWSFAVWPIEYEIVWLFRTLKGQFLGGVLHI
jgi:hypothetical protein